MMAKSEIKIPKRPCIEVLLTPEEWLEYAEYVKSFGGALGPHARVLMLKAARAAKEQVSA